MVVMKFGGTSVESAEALRRVAAIVESRLPRRPVVVVSAMGKTTNRLLAMARIAASGQRGEALELWQTLRDDHLRESLNDVHQLVQEHCEELRELLVGLSVVGELTPRSWDAVASFGERISSHVAASAFRDCGLPAVQMDSRTLLVTDDRHTHATPLVAETRQRLREHLFPIANDQVMVVGGFIGATELGVTTTLGRGGSDYSASLIGAGLGAKEIEIWTDVDGMLTADPALIPGAHRVRVLSFDEAAELAYFGAKVLHPATVLPARELGIPVLILNSRRPAVEGTRIVPEVPASANVVKSIACKRDITLLNIHSTRMLMASGFLHRIFGVFAQHETAVDMVTTSEVSVSLTIDDATRLEAITQDLQQYAEVLVEPEHALVCLVGENIRHTSGVVGRAFCALRDINVRMISQGASLLNLSFAVKDNDVACAVERLHAEFFSSLDEAVFAAQQGA